MSTLLYALTALLPFVAIGAFFQIRYYRRQRAHLPTSEWLEGMRKLDTVKPVASRLEGKAGVCSPLKKPKVKRKSLYVVKRKTGTEGGK